MKMHDICCEHSFEIGNKRLMKKILLNTLLVITTLASVAQPVGEIFPDFTFNDLDGVEHNLQSYLDEGKTVVIDVFATWCPPCQGSVPGIEELYSTYGPIGDQTMVVLSFERDPSTNNEADFIAQYGVESPVITEATELIADTWNITYQPRYFVICPDGSFMSQLSSPIYSNPQPLIDLANECESVTGVSELDIANGFALVNSSFETEVRYNSQIEQLKYTVLDLTGSVVTSGVIPAGSGTIELSSLPRGMYLLQLINGNTALTKRIIKTS